MRFYPCLGERSGHNREKDIERSLSERLNNITSKYKGNMPFIGNYARDASQYDQKLQEECEQMAIEIRVAKKIKEERAHVKGEVNKMIKEQMIAFMTRMQQGVDFRLGYEKWKMCKKFRYWLTEHRCSKGGAQERDRHDHLRSAITERRISHWVCLGRILAITAGLQQKCDYYNR
ncbi:hypothetical protein HAX54_016340 [Datura stramonium]|uniref:Uncharacterized protein n=1 Tax=Datura stramonium TaxID=4076 RepID=A0ABS8UIP0_DATST|nr:hypothetical protein [Datura stramonium]